MILRGSYLEVIVSDTCRKQSSAYLMVGIRSWWEEYYVLRILRFQNKHICTTQKGKNMINHLNPLIIHKFIF